MKIQIDIPVDLEEYAPHIEGLLRLQIAKLFVNAHKATPERREVEVFVTRMREELEELEGQLGENRLKGNALLEIADIANFALLSYIALRNEQMGHKGNVDERSALRIGSFERIPVSPQSFVLLKGEDARSGVSLGNSADNTAAKCGGTQLLRSADGDSVGCGHSVEGHESGYVPPEPVCFVARLLGSGDRGPSNAYQKTLKRTFESRTRAVVRNDKRISQDAKYDSATCATLVGYLGPCGVCGFSRSSGVPSYGTHVGESGSDESGCGNPSEGRSGVEKPPLRRRDD